MPQAEGTAHGKCILIGEHSVVHGTPAIAMPVGMSLTVGLGNVPVTTLPEAFVDWFAEMATSHCGKPLVPARITGDLPAGSGLGSSAALGVAALRALANVQPMQDATLLVMADASERVFHGNPSGIDVRAVLSETAVRFRRGGNGGETTPVPTSEKRQYFQVWLTPQGDSTAAVVARVSANLEASGRKDAELAEAATLVARAEKAWQGGDSGALGECMSSFHAWLARQGASTPLLDSLVARACAQGALGAKLTGGGGGGAMLVLAPEERWHVPDLPENVRVFGFGL